MYHSFRELYDKLNARKYQEMIDGGVHPVDALFFRIGRMEEQSVDAFMEGTRIEMILAMCQDGSIHDKRIPNLVVDRTLIRKDYERHLNQGMDPLCAMFGVIGEMGRTKTFHFAMSGSLFDIARNNK